MTINDQYEKDGFVGLRQDNESKSILPTSPAVDALLDRLIHAARHHQSISQLDGLMGTSEGSARLAVEDAKAALQSVFGTADASLAEIRRKYVKDTFEIKSLNKRIEDMEAQHRIDIQNEQVSARSAVIQCNEALAALTECQNEKATLQYQLDEMTADRDRWQTAHTECQKQEAELREKIAEIRDTLDGEPTYHDQGMGCGLEDRGITDRYEAMAHGWECAMERVYAEHVNHAKEIAEGLLATLSPKSEVTKPNAVLPKEAPEEIIEAIVKDTRARLSYADAEDIYTAIYNTLNKEGA